MRNLYYAQIKTNETQKLHRLYWCKAFNKHSANRKLRKILRKELRPNGYEEPFRYNVIKYKHNTGCFVNNELVLEDIRLW